MSAGRPCASQSPDGSAPFSAVRLLVVDPELGGGLPAAQLAAARRELLLPSVELPPGEFALEQLRDAAGVRGRTQGILVLSGALTLNVEIAARGCARLIGVRDLVLFDGVETDSIPARWAWSVLATARVAIFDDRLLAIARRWPPLLSAILARAALQTRQATLQQAISQLPRVEQRLLALLWTIADRQGVVRPDGVWVDLRLTHETLAQMIGAQRPTVSLGLARLAESGLARAESGGWLLAPDSAQQYGARHGGEAPSAPGEATEPLRG